ncbi:MAG: hypothetical protein BWK76_08570 [Desulfobulbaceae bacterium A2]|nr:MAG: hypothetical protein BWK76_08570 [Desulfobulbaceae bacterium A2]
MNEEISQLIALQEVDSEIGKFDKEISLYDQSLLQQADTLAALEQQLTAIQERRQAIELRQRDLKLQLEEGQTRIKERQNKMLRVQTSREHQSLLKEIEDAKQVVRVTEEELLGLMEEQETLDQDAERLLKSGEEGRQSLVTAENNARTAIAAITERKQQASVRRKKLAAGVPAALLTRYEGLLTRRQGVAIIQVKSGVCQGCFMTIPPQQYNEVVKGDKLYCCPTCQRILHYQPEAE